MNRANYQSLIRRVDESRAALLRCHESHASRVLAQTLAEDVEALRDAYDNSRCHSARLDDHERARMLLASSEGILRKAMDGFKAADSLWCRLAANGPENF